MRLQRLLHLVDHETEAGEIEVARPIYPAVACLVADHKAENGTPEKKINDVTKFSGEPANRFEQHGHS